MHAASDMAQSQSQSQSVGRRQDEFSLSQQPQALSRVEFVVSTYPDLQPFLEMAIVLLEGVYEHIKQVQAPTTQAPTK